MSFDVRNSIIIGKPSYKEFGSNGLVLNKSKTYIENVNAVEDYYKMDPKLKLEDIFTIFQTRFLKNYKDIAKALKTFDLEDNGVVTNGELRRVIDLYCLPLTTNQYNSLLTQLNIVTRNGSVHYRDLLDNVQEVNGRNDDRPGNKLPQLQRNATTLGLSSIQSQSSHVPKRSIMTPARNKLSSSCSSRISISQSSSRDWNYGGYSIDEIIPILQLKIGQNPSAVRKAFQLFDFNSDNHIQSHRLRKVLENYCCFLTDQQFDKLLTRFSYSQNGVVDYMEFLNNIGIPMNGNSIQKIKDEKKPIEIDLTKDRHTKLLEIAKKSTGLLDSGELEDLLIIFREKIEDQFVSLRKAFLVMDPKGDGHISLDVLHSVLNQFVFAMSFGVLKQIMEKCSFKATGTISWLTFLNKFQDPQSKRLNGSTLPIKSENRCNAVLGANRVSNIDELLELLYKHISSNYPSFRDAFLQLNKTHKGKISKSEFLKIMDRFNFEITRDQAKAIFTYLDPNSRGFVSYHHFLTLFEPTENLAAHKWLNSNHKVYEVKTNPKISDATIKSTLTQNITDKWSRVISEFKAVDPSGSGFITIDNLKKTFVKLFGYLSNDDVERLVTNITLRDAKGRISYLELFNLLNIDPQPTDTDGLSTQISNANESDAKERHADHMEKMDFIDKTSKARSDAMSVNEIVVRMKDHLLQNRSNFYEIFKKFECHDKQGGMNRAQFKKMLHDIGYSFSDDQFILVCDAVNFPSSQKTRVDYNWFVTSILDNRQCSDELKDGPCFLPESNHHVNAIRGEDARHLSSLEVEALLRQKIVNKFADLRSAFHKVDVNSRGYLTKVDFRQFVDSYLILISDEQFNTLCDKLNITANSKLSYSDFLDRFQIRDDVIEGHKWLQSKHKFNDTSTNQVPVMTAEQVYLMLPEKIYQTYQFISPTFCHIATSGTGYITFKNLRELLTKLQINISREEARKLWKMYDVHNNKKLNFNDFLENMNLLEKFSAGDQAGMSSQIIQNSHDTLIDHLAEQEVRHQQSTDNQSSLGRNLHIEHLFEIVKRHIRSNFVDTSTAFKNVTAKRSLTGFFKLDDLNCLLSNLHLFITNDRFMQLAARLGFEGPEDSLSYDRFCAIFQEKVHAAGEEGYVENISRNNQEHNSSTFIIEEAGNISQSQITSVISRKIIDQYEEIEKTFLAMDSDNSGHVTVTQFRNLLTAFCLSLSDNQFQKYLKSLEFYSTSVEHSESTFDYRYFLKSFSQKQVTKQESVLNFSTLPMSTMPETTKKMSQQRCLEYVHESIKARPKVFLTAFKERDYAQLGQLSKSDTKGVLEQFICTMSNTDFDKFWSNQSRNEFDNVNYVDMVKKISGYSGVSFSSSINADGDPMDNILPSVVEEDTEENIKVNLERVLNKHWQIIFAKCKAVDKSLTENRSVEGSITIEDFCQIISEYDSSISLDKLASVNLYRTCKRGRYIRYGDLIRSAVLSSRGSIISQESMADVEKKFINAGIRIINSDSTKNYFPQMFKLRRHVLNHWKDIRKQLLQCDKEQNGTVTGTTIMNTLTSVCGRLSPDLFYHLMTLYDLDRNGAFHFDKFINDFLKTA